MEIEQIFKKMENKRGNSNIIYLKSDNLLHDVQQIIEAAQRFAYRAVNIAILQRNRLLGKRISEEELQGKDRAEYGAAIIKKLSFEFTQIYGKGFTKSNIYTFVEFYKAFPNIFRTVSGKFKDEKSHSPNVKLIKENFHAVCGNSSENMNEISKINREAWNEAMLYHQKARNQSLQKGFINQDFTTFDRDCDNALVEKLNEIDLKNKVVAQLPCNNGRELLSLLKFGAKKGIGFDISDSAIAEAKELATISKLNAEFHRTNILDIDDTHNNSIDFIYISEGSLQWFPSLTDYFKVISKLLKQNAQLLIYEIHPFAYFFEPANDLRKEPTLDEFISYFEKGPYSYKNGLDYVGRTTYDAKECCWYMHKFSDIINAIICNSLEIEKIDEYNLEMANNEGIKNMDKFPLSYMLSCRKK